MSGKYRWYSCPQCCSMKIQLDQYVGDAMSNDSDLLPVEEWRLKKPSALAALCNQYERGQVGLCELFSTAVKDASVSQWCHIQGEVNALHKLDCHYCGMFGFLACKDNSIGAYSPNPESSLHVHHALQWLHRHNHLYGSFFSKYETMIRYVKPKFINPLLFEKHVPLLELLQDEAVGMAFPVDSQYFDQFPLIFEGKDVAGVQHPHQRYMRAGRHSKTGDSRVWRKYLKPKHSPALGLWRLCPIPLAAHVKMHLFDVWGW